MLGKKVIPYKKKCIIQSTFCYSNKLIIIVTSIDFNGVFISFNVLVSIFNYENFFTVVNFALNFSKYKNSKVLKFETTRSFVIKISNFWIPKIWKFRFEVKIWVLKLWAVLKIKQFFTFFEFLHFALNLSKLKLKTIKKYFFKFSALKFVKKWKFQSFRIWEC